MLLPASILGQLAAFCDALRCNGSMERLVSILKMTQRRPGAVHKRGGGAAICAGTNAGGVANILAVIVVIIAVRGGHRRRSE